MLYALLAIALCQSAATAPNLLKIEDLQNETYAYGPVLSPDGTLIAFGVAKPNYAEDKMDTEIRLYDLKTSTERVLTHNRIGTSSPYWSPDGKYLSFTALDKDFNAEVYALPMNGGDAIQVTKSKTSVVSFSWSPDGSKIAFIAPEEAPKKEGAEKFNSSFEVGNDPYRISAKPMPRRLWIVPSTGGEAKCLNATGRPLMAMVPPGEPPNRPQWSPDGKTISVVSQASASYGDAQFTNRIEQVDVATGKATPLSTVPGWEVYAAANPVTNQIAMWKTVNYKSSRTVPFVHDGDKEFEAAPTLDINDFCTVWAPDGKSLLVGGNYGPTTGVWLQPIGGIPKRLDFGDVVPGNFFALDLSMGMTGAIVFQGSSAKSPSEVYYMASPNDKPVQITHVNNWLDKKELGGRQVLTWKTHDGMTADGILTMPPGFDSSKKYPLVVLPHGGPQSASQDCYSDWPQIIATHGYLVFEPNYRGSDNLGEKYMQGIWNDAGDGPGKDVFAGLKLIESKGFVDTTREHVFGWSYGGFMSAWLDGHDTRWRSATVGAGVLDWRMMRAFCDFGDLLQFQFKGALWKDKKGADFDAQSPLSYADHIKSPTLILADTGDQRVPTAQSFVLHRVLKEMGVECKFVLYNASSHFPGDPVQSEDVIRRVLDWLDSHNK